MAGISLSGLASGMDWKTTVDQLMAIEQVPQDSLKAKQAANTKLQSAFDTLKTNLTAVQTAAAALSTGMSGAPRSAQITSAKDLANNILSSSSASVSTSSGAALGQYTLNVTSMPSASSLTGTAALKLKQSAAEALKLSDYGVTAGTFTINGNQYTITTDDLSQTVSQFFGLSSGTGSTVSVGSVASSSTAATTQTPGNFTVTVGVSGAMTMTAGDGVASVSNFSVGSAGDTSNLLSALGISFSGVSASKNNYTQSIGTAVLAKASLSSLTSSVTADSGAPFASGKLTINGVEVGTFAAGDTLGSVVSAINSKSGTGVTAMIDSNTGAMRLVSNSNGANGILVSSTGGLGAVIGVEAGSTFTSGGGLAFKLTAPGYDGLTTFTSADGVVDLSKYGFGATKITPTSTGTFTAQVSATGSDYKTKINSLISAYNTLKQMLDDSTKITVTGGKVQASVFSSRSDINSLLSSIKSKIYTQVQDPKIAPGGLSSYGNLSSTYDTAAKIGIGFDSNGLLQISDSAKLDSVLASNPGAVDALLNSGGNGLTVSVQDQAGANQIRVSNPNLVAGQAISASWLPSGTTISAVTSVADAQGYFTVTLSNNISGTLGSTATYTPATAHLGIGARLVKLMSSLTGTSGLVASATTSITAQNNRLQNQVDALTRQLAQKRKTLTNSFIAMESAQSKFNNMGAQITAAFSNK